MSCFLYDIVRTPRGLAGSAGALAGVAPVKLLGQLLASRSPLFNDTPDLWADLIVGCVTQVKGQGANIARTAWLDAGLPDSVPGMTVSRFCCSGLDAIGAGMGRIALGEQAVLAAGVESCSQVPMFSDQGAWFADPDIAAATGFVHMAVAADLVALRHGFTREAMDALVLRSHQRASQNAAHHYVLPVREADGKVLLAADQAIRNDLSLDSLNRLEPAFAGLYQQAGAWLQPYITDAWQASHCVSHAPAPADGAALAVLGNEELGRRTGLSAKARLVGYSSVGSAAVPMLEGAPLAVQRLLDRHGLKVSDVDVFEFNESFAAPVLHFQQVLGVSEQQLNLFGGALARGHALGATGVMLVADALAALEAVQGRWAVIAICGGAGVASAVLMERL